MAPEYLLGFDIGGTKSAVSLGSLEGEILERRECAAGSPDQVRRFFEETGRVVLAAHPEGVLRACGISSPGPMSSERGLLINPPNLPAWSNVPMKAWMADAFRVPVAMENDANAAAYAEWLWGYKKSVENLVYLTCGTGMGAGLVLGGRLYRGKQDLAGELGHLRLRPEGPVGFYKAGSVEGFTSGPALGMLAYRMRQHPHPQSVLDGLAEKDLSGKVVGEAALAGDEFAMQVVRASASYLGEVCALLIDLLNPEVISLGSLARRLGALYLDAVRMSAQREALPDGYENCQIDVARLGERVQDLAAIAIAHGVIQ